MKRVILLLLALMILLAGCSRNDSEQAAAEVLPAETVPAEVPEVDPDTLVTEHTAVVNGSEDLLALDRYPNLAKLDIRGSTCYADIAAYIDSHPQVEVTYDVSIGGKACPMDTVSLTLEDGSFTAEQLMQDLAWLPQLTELSLPCTTLSREEQLALKEAYPDLAVSATVSLLGEEIDADTSALDLSALLSDQAQEAADVLSRLTALNEVQLMTAEGTSGLSPVEVKLLMDAAPEASFLYSFELFGKTLTTADERVEYVRVNIGDAGVEKVRQALEILPNCTYFLMDSCNVSNEVMDELRDDYPERNVVWRIYFAEGKTALTDATIIRTIGDIYDSNCKQLKYCRDVEYMDIGHCYHLTDISFIAYMPKLKVLIMSDCHTSTLEPLRVCKDLEWLEIVNCNQVTDLSPLADCTSLKGINMSFLFSADDLTPLYGLQNLERLFMGRNDLPQETIDEVRAALPNCWVTDHSESVQWISFNYSIGWRLDDEHTLADWYLEICPIFGYTRVIY